MANATVIPFPTQRRVQPQQAGNLYLSRATELVLGCEGSTLVALRISAEGDLTLIEQESDFFADAITAPGFACLCSAASNPLRIAARLQQAHVDALAWRDELSEA